MENIPVKLPSTADLYEDNLQLAKVFDDFNRLVNIPPKKEWVKQNKYANNTNYLPIGVVETLMQKIFKRWRVEVLREGVMFNSVYVTVRVHYLNLTNNEWSYHDGVGAVQLQTKQGTSPADLQNINNNAVMMALPMSKSYAIKDACEHIGAVFGRDLNRKDTLVWSEDISISKAVTIEEDRVKKMVDKCKTIEDCTSLKIQIPKEYHYIIKEKEDLIYGK